MEISGTALLGARDNFYRFDAFVHTSVAYVFGSEILVLYKSLSDVLLLFSLNPNVCRLIRPVCHNKVKIFYYVIESRQDCDIEKGYFLCGESSNGR